MTEILNAALAFPTVIYTALLAILLLYWISVILGAFDIDLFHADHGGLEGLDGAADGAAEAAAHAVGDAAAHAVGEAAAHAVGEAAAHAAGEVGAEVGGHAGGDGVDVHGGSSALSALGLRRVPVTVAASLIVLFAWIAAMLGMRWTAIALGTGAFHTWAVGTGVFLLAAVIGLILASFAIKPLAPFFETQHAKSVHDYVGSTCTITTGRVDADFGQARIKAGGDVLDIAVRCDQDDAGLSRNHEALIIDYDTERNAYVVEPITGVLAQN